MLKIIRYVLYGLAILSGVAGLLAGGLPLAQFARERLQAEDSARDYYDTTYLHAPEIIFLLSLILLVGVCIGLALEKGISPAEPPRSEKPAGPQRTEAAAISASKETPAPPSKETADNKLSRLVKGEKD